MAAHATATAPAKALSLETEMRTGGIPIVEFALTAGGAQERRHIAARTDD